jgi:phage gp46-like protein
MTDIALAWDSDAFAADLLLSAGALATDDGLRTAVIISLFSDARARDDDPLPQPGADKRGWWGDALAEVEGDRIGSRLWLLHREKITPSVLTRARDYARDALAWLIEDGIAKSIEVTAEAIRPATLGLGIVITRPEGPARQRFDFVWEATA